MYTTFTRDKEKITLTLSFLAYNLADNSVLQMHHWFEREPVIWDTQY